MVELLAPVGSREALIAAVEGGADAVYLGGKMFGARAYAPNFSDEELAEVVQLAHLRGVLVYVTVNTLIDNTEILPLAAYIKHLYQISVDAVIVQDMGVATIVRNVAPDMPIHASTQMTIHNLQGVQFLAEQGFSRVVLARELSLAAIEHVCKNSPIEIETFIHGALCISYSGQCLMSSLIGGRSGNRGRCAQPCRLPYTLVDQAGNNVLAGEDAGEYLLSPKDFNTIELLHKLIAAGVASFKIEGRMKRPEYVAVVVDTYRRALDAYLANGQNFTVDEQEIKNLAQIFNRDFTTAYLLKKQGRKMMSDRRPNNRGVRLGRVVSYDHQNKQVTIKLDEPLYSGDMVEFWVKVGGRVSATVAVMMVNGQETDSAPGGTEVSIPVPAPVKMNDRVFKTFDARMMEHARSFFSGSSPLHPISVAVSVEVSEGKPLSITMVDQDGFHGQASTGFLAQKALNRPLTVEVIAKQAERLGTTVFKMKNIQCNISGAVMVPISEINDARRRAVEELEKARLARFSRPPLPQTGAWSLSPAKIHPPKVSKPELTVNVDTMAKVEAALNNGADVIMFGGECFDQHFISREEYRQVVAAVRQYGKKIILSLPRLIAEGQMPGVLADFALFHELQPDAVSVGNLGTLYIAKQFPGLTLHGDYPLNIYNAVAIDFLKKQGVASLTLSPELNFSQIEELAGKSEVVLECLVHGYMTMMVSEYCVIGSYLGGLHTGSCKKACSQGQYWLKDRKDEQFPVATDQFCRMHILNAKELSMLPHVSKFHKMGIGRIRIEGKPSAAGHVASVTKLYREFLDQGEASLPPLRE